MLSKACRVIFWLYVAAAALAFLLVPASEFSLFGMERTALAGVFAVLLAQPWISLLPDAWTGGNVAWNMIVVAGCLVLNAAILRLVCHLARRCSLAPAK